MKIFKNIFNKIISLENLFSAWEKFKKNKNKKLDVLRFEINLEQNIFQLHYNLKNQTYQHGEYQSFYINDPVQRHIHKAVVRDRVLHHAIYKIIMPIFEPTFISNSFSCRPGKGTHKGVSTVESMLCKESCNYTITCFALKGDIKKFFGSVKHKILLKIINKKIKDEKTMWLIKEVIGSFSTKNIDLLNLYGLPIGNLTSQLFANIYMNEFDQFIKHKLIVKQYVRYTDDFIIISKNKDYLTNLIKLIQEFLKTNLALKLHPKKISIKKISQGVDFLGYILFPYHRLLRTKTKKRIFKKMKQQIFYYHQGHISEKTLNQSLQSYLGTLSHANTYQLSKNLKNYFWFWITD